MAKANPLTQALKASTASKKTRKTRSTEDGGGEAPAKTGNGYIAPSRVNLVNVSAHFPVEVKDQLKLIAVTQRKTLQAIMAEAIDMVFVRYNQPAIASRTAAE